MEKQYIIEWIDTKIGKIPRVSSDLSIIDKIESFKKRLGIKRLNYKVDPGVYAIGNPDKESYVFVSANYKLSFDILRRELKGLNAWILVIDTKGVNVWCAAGKGTFGTEEIVNRIKLARLKNIVNHRKLIIPQLSAPGVAAHKVKQLSGFSVIYGPIRAADINAFLNAGMKATPQMRQVKFTLYDRFVLVPMELIIGVKYLIFSIVVFFLLAGVSKAGYSVDMAANIGLRSTINLLLAYIAGAVAGPILLPWLPGRSFSFKGSVSGILLFIILFVNNFTGNNSIEIIAWLLLIPAISSFILMNFTGASTYTSLSGVQKEMKIAIPLQAISAIAGLILWNIDRFI